MHKEKVSRREIGSLATSKRFPSHQKIVPPPGPPCLEPYYRRPLSFSVLDDIGHGVKVSEGLGPWVGSLGPRCPQGGTGGCTRGLSPPLMERWGLSVHVLQTRLIPEASSVGRGHGHMRQRETEAHNAQQRPLV